jgi:hypothetical protein
MTPKEHFWAWSALGRAAPADPRRPAGETVDSRMIDRLVKRWLRAGVIPRMRTRAAYEE